MKLGRILVLVLNIIVIGMPDLALSAAPKLTPGEQAVIKAMRRHHRHHHHHRRHHRRRHRHHHRHHHHRHNPTTQPATT